MWIPAAGSGRIFFSYEAAWGDDSGAGGDDQRTIGTDQHRAHGLDRAPVRLTVLLIFRELVDEGQMNDSIGVGRPTAQAIEVFLALPGMKKRPPSP